MPNELETRITAMTVEELVQMGREYDSLTEEAQALVRAEFKRRSMEPPLVEESVDDAILQGVSTIASTATRRRRCWRAVCSSRRESVAFCGTRTRSAWSGSGRT